MQGYVNSRICKRSMMVKRKLIKTVKFSGRNRNRRNKTTSFHIETKFAKFTAGTVSLEEVAINNLVLRVKLIGVSLNQDTRMKFKNKKNGFNQTGSVIKQSTIKTKTKKIDCNRNNVELFEQPSYCLDISSDFHVHQSKLSYPFQKFAQDIVGMKLPDSAWKINVWQNKFPTINITNNSAPERSITFIQRSLYFRLIVEDTRVLLLGCPPKVESIQDIEVLTKIISSIALDDCMIMLV